MYKSISRKMQPVPPERVQQPKNKYKRKSKYPDEDIRGY